jgi:hypothetical protein
VKNPRRWVLFAVVALTGAFFTAPVAADPLSAPLGPPPVEAAPAASSTNEGPVTYSTAAPDDGLVTSSATTPVAPGLKLTEFDRYDPQGWIRGDTLAVDLTSRSLRPTYLSPGVVSARTPLSELVKRAGAVAGVNGDFFDINATGAPIGVRLTEFQSAFGDTRRVVDVHGIRLVLLDSSRGTMRGGGFDQVRMLREALDSATTRRSVGSRWPCTTRSRTRVPPADRSSPTARKQACSPPGSPVSSWLRESLPPRSRPMPGSSVFPERPVCRT